MITSESHHYPQSSLAGRRERGRSVWRMHSPLSSSPHPAPALPLSCPSFRSNLLLFLFTPHKTVFFFPPRCCCCCCWKPVFIYSSLLSVICKAKFVPVGWESNRGRREGEKGRRAGGEGGGGSRCHCAAVDCTAHCKHTHSLAHKRTPPRLHSSPNRTTRPKQDRCWVCMLPAFPASIFLPGIPDCRHVSLTG